MSEEEKARLATLKKPHFIKQRIRNACGTMALLHTVANIDVGAHGEASFMERLLKHCEDGKSPEELSDFLRDDEELAVVHKEYASQG